MPRNAGPILAIIGGGRWARVVISVLARMELPFARVVVVTAEGAQAVARHLDRQPAPSRAKFAILPSLVALLKEDGVKAAVIVNTARLHVETASRLLAAGVDVLVEKPIALSTRDTEALIATADAAGVKLVPGLQYRFCNYVHRFADEVRRLSGGSLSVSLTWADGVGEKRYGEAKSYDASLNVAQDVMPHVWTILSVALGRHVFRFASCRIECGGRIARFALAGEALRGEVVLERDARERRRVLATSSDTGESLSMDFSEEPGTIVTAAGNLSGDPLWAEGPRPMARQLGYFFSGSTDPAADRQACRDSVAFSESASALFVEQQRAMLCASLRRGNRLDADARYALRELLAPGLIERGLVRAGDNTGIEAIAAEAAEAIAGDVEVRSGALAELMRELGL